MSSNQWTRIVELARQVQGEYQSCGVVDSELVVRLTRAILVFQEHMVGNLVRSLRRP